MVLLRTGTVRNVARPNPTSGDSVLDDLLTVSEAARLLRTSRKTIEKMVARGVLSFFDLPVRGGLRFARTELEAFVRSRHHDPLETSG